MTWTTYWAFFLGLSLGTSIGGARRSQGEAAPQPTGSFSFQKFFSLWSLTMAGVTALLGLTCMWQAFRMFFFGPVGGPSGAFLIVGVVCFGLAWLFLGLGFRIGREDSLPGRFSRAAEAAVRAFRAPPADHGKPTKPAGAASDFDLI